jgi:hypothetical protein
MDLAVSQEIPPQLLTRCGAGMIALSASLPWLVGGTGTVGLLHPIFTPALRPSALVVLTLVVVGAAGGRRSTAATAIAGCGGLLWMTSALTVWLFGLRLQGLTPAALLPDGLAVRTGVGSVLGIVGGFTLVLAAVLDVSQATWPTVVTRWRLQLGRVGLVMALSLLLVASRGTPWVRVQAGSDRWSLGADALPVVSDMLAVLTLAGVVVLWVWALERRRITSCAMLAIGLAATALGGAAGLVVGVSGAPIGAFLRRLDVTANSAMTVETGWGPWVLAIVGVTMVLIAVVSLVGTRAVRQSGEGFTPSPLSAADATNKDIRSRRYDDLPPG